MSQILPILFAFWPAWVAMFIIFSFAAFFKSPFFKGWLGETMVNIALKLSLDKKKYRLIRNVTVPTDGGTTQIDHVVVSIYGIFVIETKNMKGWIYGSQKDSTWTQKIFKYTNKFQNPLRQNYKHTQTLAEILNLPSDLLISIVVFAGDSKFKTEMPPNVVHGIRVISLIKSYTKPVMSEAQVESMISKIAEERLMPGFKTNRKHLEHVQTIVENKRILNTGAAESNPPTCPKCGGPMVIRQARQSGNRFWGCSKYPQCRAVIALVSSEQ